jgi:protein LSM14
MEQKMKLEENEEQPIGVKPTTEDDEEKLEGYDKSTSFFDNISCEANNVTKRSTRNHDNALNTETFGVTSRGYNRGGWSKGGRGPRRGYYHRGGNRSYNNYYSQGNEGSSYRGHYKGRGRGRGYNRDNQSYTRNDYRS